MNTEKKIENELMSVVMGASTCTDLKSFYIEARSYVTPLDKKDEGYSNDVYEIRHNFSSYVGRIIAMDPRFDLKSYIVDFQLAESGLKVGKKSYVTFQIVIRVNDQHKCELDDLCNSMKNTINDMALQLKQEFERHGFIMEKKR